MASAAVGRGRHDLLEADDRDPVRRPASRDCKDSGRSRSLHRRRHRGGPVSTLHGALHVWCRLAPPVAGWVGRRGPPGRNGGSESVIAHGQQVAVQGQQRLVCSVECTPPEAQVVQVPLHLRDRQSTDAHPLQILDRRAHFLRVPLRPVIAVRQPRHTGASTDGDHLDSEALRTLVLAQGQEPLCQGNRGKRVHMRSESPGPRAYRVPNQGE